MKRPYYSDSWERPTAGGGSFVGWLTDLIMTLLSLIAAVLMILTYCVPYLNPSFVWFIPILGLAAPAIYVANVILLLYWIIRWRCIRAGIMLLIVVVGLFKVSLFWRPEFRRNYGEADFGRNAFKVMTYNVRSFYGEKGESSVGNVLQLIARENPDIICMQEFNARLAEKSDQFALLDETYETARFGRTQAPDSLFGSSMAILSKYHILHSGVILSPNSAVWVDVMIGDDTVRIFNNHLRSTAITASDNEFITNRRFLSDTAREVKIRSIVTRLRENSILRAEQVDSIATVIAATQTPKIVCGDFNDTPMSYVYRRMASELNDAFSACGSGYAHTFRGFYNTLRIDYVLSSDAFETLSYEVIPVDFSDHHPVVVRLQRGN